MQQQVQDRYRRRAPMATVTPIVDRPALPKPSGPGSSRLDAARGDTELRPIYLRTGVVRRAAGSAYVEMGQTKVVSSVHGPRQKADSVTTFSEVGRLSCALKFAPFSTPLRSEPHETQEEREMASSLSEALSVAVRLDRYPKSYIDVYVEVVQHDGGVFSAAVIAASLALADAGIEMFDLVSSCGAVVLGGVLRLDPTRDEELAGTGVLATAVMPALGRTTQLLQAQSMPREQSTKVIELCTDACGAIAVLMRRTLMDRAAQPRPPST